MTQSDNHHGHGIREWRRFQEWQRYLKKCEKKWLATVKPEMLVEKKTYTNPKWKRKAYTRAAKRKATEL